MAEGEQELIKAAAEGNGERIRELLSEEVDINAQDENGNTALHHAASRGYKECVRILLEQGARVDIPNKNGQGAKNVATTYSMIELLNRVPIRSLPEECVRLPGFSNIASPLNEAACCLSEAQEKDWATLKQENEVLRCCNRELQSQILQLEENNRALRSRVQFLEFHSGLSIGKASSAAADFQALAFRPGSEKNDPGSSSAAVPADFQAVASRPGHENSDAGCSGAAVPADFQTVASRPDSEKRDAWGSSAAVSVGVQPIALRPQKRGRPSNESAFRFFHPVERKSAPVSPPPKHPPPSFSKGPGGSTSQ